MFKAWLEACPWDVIEPTVATLLDRLHGEIGVAGLTIPVAVPPLKTLRTHGHEVVPFITNGGLAFRPSERGSLPSESLREADFVGGGDPLAACAQACLKSELALRLLVDVDVLGPWLADPPDLIRIDAFGRPIPGRVCLSHNAIAGQLRALIEEITRRYEPASIELVDSPCNGSNENGARWGFPVSPVADALFAICFCDACCAAANEKGADGEAASKAVCQYVKTEVAAGRQPPSTPDQVVSQSPALGDYCRAIGVARSELVSVIEGSGAPALSLRIADRDRRISLRDLPALAHAESAVIVSSNSPADRMPEPVEQTSCTLYIGSADLRQPDAARLVALMKDATAAGYTGVELSHLAACNETALGACRQALRIARRKDM